RATRSSSWTAQRSSWRCAIAPSSPPWTAPTCATTSSPTSTARSSHDASRDQPTKPRPDLHGGRRTKPQGSDAPMMRGMFSAISGLKVHQTMLDVTANNLANVNTVGFKASRTTFKDSLTQLYRSGAASSSGQGGANAAQVGLGVALGSIDNLMTTGSVQSTGNPLDVAIQGEGWFRVANGAPSATSVLTAGTTSGQTNYTRAGDFTRNDAGHLVTQEGYYVL